MRSVSSVQFHPPASPKQIFAYRRIYEDGDRRETADVFLNFSKREVSLDLRAMPAVEGAQLHSNLHDAPVAAKGRHVLRPWESAVVLAN